MLMRYTSRKYTTAHWGFSTDGERRDDEARASGGTAQEETLPQINGGKALSFMVKEGENTFSSQSFNFLFFFFSRQGVTLTAALRMLIQV